MEGFPSLLSLFRNMFIVNRRPYMSTHVIFNSLNKVGNSDKMRGLPSISSLFCNEFNKFKIQEHKVKILFIIHFVIMMFNNMLNRVFCVKMSRFCKKYVTLLCVS